MFAQFIAPAITFGLSATSIPGPLQALVINIALQYGWRRALWVILAPPIVDFPIIIVIVFILGQLPLAVLQIIRLLGGLLLFWIAWGAYKQYRSGAGFTTHKNTENPIEYTPRRVFWTGIAMNAMSPGPYLFWSTVTGPLLLLALDQSAWVGITFLFAFYGVFMGSLVILAIFVDRIGNINPRATSYLLLGTIALLIYFGIRLIIEATGVAM